MDNENPIRRPIVYIPLIALILIAAYIFMGNWDSGIWFKGIDFLICSFGFVFWLFFFAQFVLPVQNLDGRFRIFERLVLYIFRMHGPAVFVENGVVRASEAEKDRRGPGVIWLDTASAAVLRTDVAFTRTVGPGVVFTHGGEYIYNTVDLHEQQITLGPRDEDKPFATLQENASDDEKDKHKEAQERRWETSALTRDGIEVLASFLVNFKIESDPASSEKPGTPFGFNEDNVFKYVVSNASNVIIARMVVDVWREYIRKYRFDQFFQILPGEDQTLMQKIGRLLTQRLSEAMVNELDEYGQTMPRTVPSREYATLKNMGVRVTPVVRRVIFPPDLEQRLVTTWTTNWLKHSQKEKEQVEQTRVLRVRIGQEEALREFASNAAQEYQRSQPQTQPEMLELLLRGTLKGIIRNPSLQRRVTSEPNDISDIIQWVRENAGEVADD